MAPTLEQLGLDRLSAEERLAVAEAIWERVARDVDAMPLSSAQRTELERRLVDSVAKPDEVTLWEMVKAQALARLKA